MEATGWNANTGVREGIVRLLEWLQESKDILSPMYEVKEVKAS